MGFSRQEYWSGVPLHSPASLIISGTQFKTLIPYLQTGRKALKLRKLNVDEDVEQERFSNTDLYSHSGLHQSPRLMEDPDLPVLPF